MQARRSLVNLAIASVLLGAAACGVGVDLDETTEPESSPEIEASVEPASPASTVVTDAEDALTPAPASEVSVPQVSVPQVSVPQVSVPEASIVSSVDETTETVPAPVSTAPVSATLPQASVPTTLLPQASVPTTLLPQASVPTTLLPQASVPTTLLPQASVPTTSLPQASVPTTSLPQASVPTTSVPQASVPTTSLPQASVPTTSVPQATVPAASLPQVELPSVSLPVAAEYSIGYDREEWGPHNSGLCRGAVGSSDPYTGTRIDTCNVDHVVALREAHESGGWDWPPSQKQRFSQDPANHVASRACVNQSKGADDIFEWSDADISSSSACGGGYRVTEAGRCFMALTFVAVKADWGLSVDQAEADALNNTLARCGTGTGALSFDTATQPPPQPAPTTTVQPSTQCVIADRSAADYEAISGIGGVLAGRLVQAQPFMSPADLQAVSGIGPARSEGIWSHFCTP